MLKFSAHTTHFSLIAVRALCHLCRWTVPSAIPVGAFGGSSLFGLLNQQIGTELAHFPTGPALDSPFWLYLCTWHIGLFATMLLGQVGVQGRQQGYW
jgi:photosystem I subunit PsaO